MASLLLLPEHDDEHATLEAAMAFLDSCDVNSIAGIDSAASCESPAMSTASSNHTDTESPKKCAAQQAQRKPAGRPAAPPTARRARKLNKVVIVELREQVEQLRNRLSELRLQRRDNAPALLKQCPDNGGSTGSTVGHAARESKRLCVAARGSALDLEAVLRELRRLQDAKELNSMLRNAWVAQSRIIEELRGIMAKQVAIATRYGLTLTCVRACGRWQRSADASRRVVKVEKELGMLHDDDTVVWDPALHCAAFDLPLLALYEQAAAIGAYIDLRDTTRAFSSSRVYQDYPADQTFEFDHDMLASHQHRYKFDLQCKFGPVEVDAVMAVRTFIEPRRVVLVSTSLFALEETDLLFRDTAWVLVNYTTAAGASGSPDAAPLVFQSCYRIHAEAPAESRSPVSQANAAFLEHTILQAQSERMRTGMLQLQSILLRKFGTAPPSASW
ncbi:hypothetical protein PybrP1_010715 [[Pythium] brassicae (nom. inval.)]|nr:hypothetical protein PybrP1_010715 [[Pythium] brassicae (nom. inval.)]